jgi:arylsulfatase A
MNQIKSIRLKTIMNNADLSPVDLLNARFPVTALLVAVVLFLTGIGAHSCFAVDHVATVESDTVDATSRPAKPNILIMMADDMGIGDTSAYLNVRLSPTSPPVKKTLRTPNLKRFTESAIVFTDGYAPASMCSATRYSVLTGRFAHRSYLKYQGWLPHGPNTPMIQQGLTTLPEMLQANGYRTAGIGKYHVGMSFDNGKGKPAEDFFYHDVDFTKPILDGPTHHGFDEYFGVTGNTEDPLDTEPRILIRNDRFTFTDRSEMKLIGMKDREGRILSAPDWDLRKLGPLYLEEAKGFLTRQSNNHTQPFFLYYVPNANHFQRNPNGDYAVPDEIAGTRIKGESRYSDDSVANDREDMVLENDVVFGKLLEKLKTTDDPRWPGHKLVENTLIIFTSDNGPNVGDNLGPNQESGKLRGKKAKLWEGGIRVPLIVSWPAVLEGGKLNRSIVTLTDLYATLAHIIGHTLNPEEAQDSHNVFAYWSGTPETPDNRPRVFFCHLGPPFLNDALAIRQGPNKLIVEGGLAMPWVTGGSRGTAKPIALYNLQQDLYETQPHSDASSTYIANGLADTLLRIHNRGHARQYNAMNGGSLIQNTGWHNLRNDVTGEVGFSFQLRPEVNTKVVTHLGMFDDHDRDKPVRAARSVPRDNERDQPSKSPLGGKNHSLKSPHVIRLLMHSDNKLVELARCHLQTGTSGELLSSFRYLRLKQPVYLKQGQTYILLMSTQVADGDHFRDPVSFDGLSPQLDPDLVVQRGLLLREGTLSGHIELPAFEDLSSDYSQYRLPVGPNLRFAEDGWSDKHDSPKP